MKEFLPNSMLALVMDCGSLRNGKTVEASAANTERVVVTAVLQDEERVLARPQIMLDNGKEGELQISTQMPVPGREDAIATRLHLAILPRVNGGLIVFQGHWVRQGTGWQIRAHGFAIRGIPQHRCFLRRLGPLGRNQGGESAAAQRSADGFAVEFSDHGKHRRAQINAHRLDTLPRRPL